MVIYKETGIRQFQMNVHRRNERRRGVSFGRPNSCSAVRFVAAVSVHLRDVETATLRAAWMEARQDQEARSCKGEEEELLAINQEFVAIPRMNVTTCNRSYGNSIIDRYQINSENYEQIV